MTAERRAYPFCFSTNAAKASIYCCSTFCSGFLGELALVVEGVADAIQVDFGLAEDRAGNTRQDVLQMLGRADAAERVRESC